MTKPAAKRKFSPKSRKLSPALPSPPGAGAVPCHGPSLSRVRAHPRTAKGPRLCAGHLHNARSQIYIFAGYISQTRQPKDYIWDVGDPGFLGALRWYCRGKAPAALRQTPGVRLPAALVWFAVTELFFFFRSLHAYTGIYTGLYS